MKMMTLLLLCVLLTGCSSIWLKHPDTQQVAECDPSRWFGPTTWWSVFPGQMLVHRHLCVNEWEARGYVEVDKCKYTAPGVLCVTSSERRAVDER
jgi:hypothetical protein